MMQNNEAMYPRFPVYKRSEGERAEGKKKKKKRASAWESERDATCWTMWFNVVSKQHP